ncbi:MAG: LysE family translocator, partial [Pseudomonadota bacterium]|nr:LysE family translocator [Pseudomonadota bacterium]
AFIEARHPPGVLSAVVLQVLNPKAYAVNTALFTGFSFAPDSLWFEIGAKLLIANLIWFPLHFLWLWAGVRLHALELSQRWQRVINLGMAVALVAVAVLSAVTLLFA